MAAIITEKFRLNNAKQFVEDITQDTSVAYSFIGRGHAWADDASPPTPVDNPNDEFDAYRNMVAMKKIGTSDISHAIVRRDWTSGTTYDEYRHNYASGNAASSGATTLWSSLFYVVTDDYNVYKCISNGTQDHSAANASTVKPDHTTLATPTESADQYQWKYMYSISASDVIKFVTNDFIPVKTLGAQLAVAGGVDNQAGNQDGKLADAASDDGSAQWDVENGAVDGALDKVRIKAAGSGYTASTTTSSIAIRGDGASGVAQVVTDGSGNVSDVNITTAGSGYTYAFINDDDIGGSAREQASDGTSSTANIEFIIQPKNGHGSDPIEELGGNYVILNSRLEYSEGSGDFPTDNDFRQIGVVVNPTNYDGNVLCSAGTRTAYKTMTLGGSNALPSVDTVIRNASTEAQGSAVGIVVSVDSTNRILSYLPYPNKVNDFNVFSTSETVFSSTSTNHGAISALANEEVERHSGDIIYLENRTSVSRASDQIEDIKLIVEM